MKKILIDLLKRAHAQQIAVMQKNDGHSLHIDTSSNEDFRGVEHRASFDVTLFSDSELLKSWDFNFWDEDDLLEHKMQDLEFTIERL